MRVVVLAAGERILRVCHGFACMTTALDVAAGQLVTYEAGVLCTFFAIHLILLLLHLDLYHSLACTTPTYQHYNQYQHSCLFTSQYSKPTPRCLHIQQMQYKHHCTVPCYNAD
jgi:hypothetical protein